MMLQPENFFTHRCTRRNDDEGKWRIFCAWWLLPFHLLIVGVVAFTIIYVVNGRAFLLVSQSAAGLPNDVHIVLYQSDVTTLVSIALVVVRVLAGSWFSLAAWRMVFISLEMSGMTLRDAKRMLEYGVPSLPFVCNDARGKKRQFRTSKRFAMTLWLMFLLALPAQFVAPLAAGSITWIPDSITAAPGYKALITSAGPGARWDWWQEYAKNRLFTVYRAAALASIFPVSSFDGSASRLVRRQMPSIRGVAINSILAEATVPHFNINSLEWITSASDFNDTLKDPVIYGAVDILADYTGTLNISSPDNPLRDVQYGEISMINENPWNPQSPSENGSYSFPESVMIYGTSLVVVLFNQADQEHHFSSCHGATSVTFGDPGRLALYSVREEVNILNCFALARLNFTAGVAVCQNCPVVADSVIEATPSPSQPQATLPDPLVHDSISMMPETLSYMSVMNISLVPTWENLDAYTRGMLSVAYQASWNSLSNEFQTGDPTETAVAATIPVLVAHVARWRMLTWLGLNALLTISGILLAVLQSTCSGKTVRDPAMTALLLDSKAVLDSDADGLCNTGFLSKNDANCRIRLLVSSEIDGAYHHPRLVPD